MNNLLDEVWHQAERGMATVILYLIVPIKEQGMKVKKVLGYLVLYAPLRCWCSTAIAGEKLQVGVRGF